MYYCENCFKDNLKEEEVITDEQGGKFCTRKCLLEYQRLIEDYRKDE
jgi:hypothetical protein|tara:strand:+ start:2231 stop:2371 length:141 start_codon:yes stop_codon:yes gene_type:complete